MNTFKKPIKVFITKIIKGGNDFEENQKIETQKFIVFKREQENERDKS